MSEAPQPAARKPARKPAAKKPAAKRKPTTRRTTTGRTTRRTTRRRTSTASSLGTAAGAALAGVVAAALGGLPWWGWVLLIVVGLVVGLGYAAVRGRRLLAAERAADPQPETQGGADPA